MQGVDAALFLSVGILALDTDMPLLHLKGLGGQFGKMRLGPGHVRAEHGLAAWSQMTVHELAYRCIRRLLPER